MLVASQVLLSIVLPTVIFPLVYLCSKTDIMTVQGPEPDVAVGPNAHAPTTPVDTSILPVPESAEINHLMVASSSSSRLPPPSPPRLTSESEIELETPAPIASTGETAEPSRRKSKSFRSPLWVTILGYLLFTVVILCNVYVIVELAMGNDG